MGDGDGPAIGVVVHGDALAAGAGFFYQAVGGVVLEVKAGTVLVEEGLQAVGGVVGELNLAAFGVLVGTVPTSRYWIFQTLRFGLHVDCSKACMTHCPSFSGLASIGSSTGVVVSIQGLMWLLSVG